MLRYVMIGVYPKWMHRYIGMVYLWANWDEFDSKRIVEFPNDSWNKIKSKYHEIIDIDWNEMLLWFVKFSKTNQKKAKERTISSKVATATLAAWRLQFNKRQIFLCVLWKSERTVRYTEKSVIKLTKSKYFLFETKPNSFNGCIKPTKLQVKTTNRIKREKKNVETHQNLWYKWKIAPN